MIFSCILLALSVSIDALSLGITYGIKNAKITKTSNFIIFAIAFCSTSISIFLGHYISILFSPKISAYLGSILLVILGTYTILKSTNSEPSDYDFDNSNTIEKKEALLLALAVSLDASCVGLSCGIMGINSLLYPLLAAVFHMFFINCGNNIARIICSKFTVSRQKLTLISGSILILIGIIKVIN